jgi:glycosyltransferase involved in cell wall biosynthesis
VKREIHLVNPLWGSTGGSAWRTVELYRSLKEQAKVRIWTDVKPDAKLAATIPIERIDVTAGRYPRGGTIVFIGVYHQPGDWVDLVKPRRAIVVYNIFQPQDLVIFMRRLFAAGMQNIELVYASQLLKEQTRLKGIVEYSPIDLAKFPMKPPDAGPSKRPFVVGRLSRDEPSKHHPDDLALYQKLVERGCHVRIMGGMCLAAQGAVPAGVELISAGGEPPADFLQTLDCFLYRTSPAWLEAFGRVIFEAMASGLPVVAHQHGGYVREIRQGENGFLFGTNEEAVELVDRLSGDARLYQRIVTSGRATVEAMYSPEAREKVVEYYLL